MNKEVEAMDKAFEDIGWLLVHAAISLAALGLAAIGVFYL